MASVDDDRTLLVLRVRRSRGKAVGLAVLEAVSVLGDLGAEAVAGGPFGDEAGTAWVTIPAESLDDASALLPRLGYTTAVDALVPSNGRVSSSVRWRGKSHAVRRIYEEDEEGAREAAVDRRSFVIATDTGTREVLGYRGDGGALSRRGLAVADSRLLANLASPRRGDLVLDVFAGVGGVVIELERAGANVISTDLDRVVAPGLAAITTRGHVVGDAGALPFQSGTVGAVATETPFDEVADDSVVTSLGECARVAKPASRIAFMTAPRQAERLRPAADALGLRLIANEDVDRKGLAVTVLVWQK
jgi:hypothetical protein